MADRVTVRMDPEAMEAFERCFEGAPEGCRTRQDLLRFIVREWLANRGYLENCGKTGAISSE